MNAWDFFTWVSAAALGASSVLIFSFFLRDARAFLKRERNEDEEAEERDRGGWPLAAIPRSRDGQADVLLLAQGGF